MSLAPDIFGEQDAYLFREGTHTRLHDKLGGRVLPEGLGANFSVWAPNADYVSVIGDWNGWKPDAHPLFKRPDHTGIWSGEFAAAQRGHMYKFHVVGPHGRYRADKADPYALCSEPPPRTGSRLWTLEYEWSDAEWMNHRRRQANAPDAPQAIYEVHAGSWRRPEGLLPNYRWLAQELARYVLDMGFTHVELMPLTEHPFYGSWGYQTTGYFAPTSRYGEPQDLMYLVDYLHSQGIGVILDWVPSHFPTDEHGLQYFDGTHLYEHADPRQGFHPDWNSSIFNYGRHEVRSFLLSSAMFWLDRYHIDGLRVDAVASMLYLDYGRKAGEWIPNRHGGRENLEAVEFLHMLNEAVHRDHPGAIVIAEESTAWPRVSRPVQEGGLGFDLKWNMGWMHDSLAYFSRDPLHRKHHQGELSFSLVYAFHENFVLPFSHDEVVHGKGSLVGKMPGDEWQQFANLRALYGYMWAHPGKKLLFMGGEFAQRREWSHDAELEWFVLGHAHHHGVQRFMQDLNRVYRQEPALHQIDFSPEGFEWIAHDDARSSVLAFLRKPRQGGAVLLVVCNLTPVPREHYRLGVPSAGFWREIVNSDAKDYGGSGWGNLGGVAATGASLHGRPFQVSLTLPPLATLVFRHEEPSQHA